MQPVITFASSLQSLNSWWCTLQAQKRKLGLLEDDDSSKLATSASPGELNVKDISTGVGKNRGMLILFFNMCSWRKFFFIGSTVSVYLSLCYF